MSGEQVIKTGIAIPAADARLTREPVILGNCLDFSASGQYVGPVNFSWATRWSLFFKANIRSVPSGAARIIDDINSIILTGLGIQVTQGGSVITSPPETILVLNEWHDYGVVYDGAFIKYYRDGVVVSTKAVTTNPYVSAGNYYLFNRADGLRNCDMQVAYFQWYNRAFTNKEVLAHLKSAAGNLINCALYYRLQEGVGTDIVDISGNGKDTTLTGGSWSTFDLPRSKVTYIGSDGI